MYAIVDIAGQQFKVEKDQKVYVHRLDAEAGKKVNFDRVLLIDDKGKVNIGAPAIEGAQVSATVLEHLKGDKVIVFKKKRRKGYKKKNGHRQYLTEIQSTTSLRQERRRLQLRRRRKHLKLKLLQLKSQLLKKFQSKRLRLKRQLRKQKLKKKPKAKNKL